MNTSRKYAASSWILPVVLVIGALLFALSACSTEESQSSVQESQSSNYSELVENDKNAGFASYSLYFLHYEVPSTWEFNESASNEKEEGWDAQRFYNCPAGGCISVSMAGSQSFPDDFDSYARGLYKSDDTNSYKNITEGTLGDAIKYTADWYATSNGVDCRGRSQLVFSGRSIYVVNIIVPEAAYSAYKELINEMLSSLSLSSSTAVITKSGNTVTKSDSSSTESKSSQNQSAQATTAQKNALAKAKKYLSTSNFSHDRLIEQLEYEKYDHDDAVYAADNCGADWNVQASGKAKRYLQSSAFSYTGLIEQLEYEGFTEDQATYGADNCGADWNAQAAKKAESYLKSSSFSRSSLIDQLLYEGFTEDQAIYGVDSVGL